jgi:hypothetical protein
LYLQKPQLSELGLFAFVRQLLPVVAAHSIVSDPSSAS